MPIFYLPFGIDAGAVSFSYLSSSRLPQLEFERDPTYPLLLGHTEPEAIKVGDVIYMYYRDDSNRTSNGSRISVMSSNDDGLSWNELGIILTRSSSSRWDNAEVIAPSVLSENGKYYLYYEGGSTEQTGRRAIGVAISDSPTGPFLKHPDNPIITASDRWEGKIVGTPVIMKMKEIYYLFYHGYSQGHDRIGIAYSANPLGPWIKDNNNPLLDIGPENSWDDSKVAPSSVQVINESNDFLLFYEGFNGMNEDTQASWRIGVAYGNIRLSDGKVAGLDRYPLPLLDLGAFGSWDDNTVQLPSVVKNKDGKFWMFYSGHDGNAFRLGRAVSTIAIDNMIHDR